MAMNRSAQREIVRESLPAILAQIEAVAGEFHRRLFESHPEQASRFPPEESIRKASLENALKLVQVSVAHPPDQWQTHTSISKDPLLQLGLWSRPGGPLHAISPKAGDEASAALVDAVSATLDDCSADQREALSFAFARFVRAQRVLTQCTVHASGIRDKRKKNPLVMSAQLDEDLDLIELLEALSLCEQQLQLNFKDEQDKNTGSLLVKSGQVLEVHCQQERGQPAFLLLVARPHHRVKITKSATRKKYEVVGTIVDLLAQQKGRTPALLVVDPSPLAANREPLSEPVPASSYDDASESALGLPGVPTPLTNAVPLDPISTGSTMDTQPIALDPWSVVTGPGQGFRPQDLALSRVEGSWTASLQKIPHLRAVILLASQTTTQGTFWSRDGAEISISDLSRFGQAIMWTQTQLPKLFGPRDSTGWTNTTEHALGCVVTWLDSTGKVRICLFDARTPLGKVRHTSRVVSDLSEADTKAFGA